ncbi:MAG: DNA polymerase III subunit beta, partial [Gallicola sp.]|nr:DNA polymerase III subunit beta [Gallicola sp.]
LLKHIQIAQRAISARNTVQILDGILFEAKAGLLHLSSTDLEIGIHTQVPCLIEEEGKAVIKGSLIGNIVRKLPQEAVYIETVHNQMEIRCKNSEFKLVGYLPEEYPELMAVKEEFSMQITGKDWKRAIRQTIFATSQDDTKPVLRGVLFDITKEGIFVVALDGFRISLKKMLMPAEEEQGFIIPARALNEIQKITDDDQMVQIIANKGNMSFSFGDTIVYTRLLEGQFIQYQNILQTDTSLVFETKRKDLYDAMERASLLSGEERANLVKLHLAEGACVITSNTDIGHVYEKVEGTIQGDTLEIAFNARYLLDGLKEIEAEDVIMSFSGPLKPLIIESQDEQ